jgi:hypothetical protein
LYFNFIFLSGQPQYICHRFVETPPSANYVTYVKGITQASLFGVLSGTLLATTTLIWLNSNSGVFLPILVALWWLIIFGLNLWHAYQLSVKKLTSIRRFSLQFMHAALAAIVYFSIDIAFGNTQLPDAAQHQSSQLHLQAQTADFSGILTNSFVIVGAAFLLSIVTSGLLYSILSRPSAK